MCAEADDETNELRTKRTGTDQTRMRVLFSLCGNEYKASSRVRGFWIAEELEKLGAHCRCEHRHSKSMLLRLARLVSEHDVIVFQKSYSRWHLYIQRFAHFLGKRTFVDLDDAPSRSNSPDTIRNVERMMQNATGVIVGSRTLLEYAKQHQENSRLIPSSIKLDYYEPPNPKDAHSQTQSVCVGWIGNGAHYCRALIELLIEPLTVIASRHRIRFKIVGACGERRLYDAFGAVPDLQVDLVDAIDWSNPRAVSASLSGFDIGLYPLLRNDFNTHKCGFKALEYMAMRLPVVSSRVAANTEVVEHGVDGYFAETRQEWVDALDSLICDPGQRARMGHRGREKVQRAYNASEAAKQLFEVFAETR